jgi:phenylpropionate dioxygenase-like ring-hydroxylating dioxygenase large terminal subunit
MSANVPYETIPSGWYALAESHEVRPGQVKPLRYFDRDLVLYRTKSGVAQVSDAFCPHLGGYLGDGCVREERLRCPFHGFEFDLSGACVATPYPGGRPPQKARLALVPVREKYGIVFGYHDRDGRAPTWEVPDLALDGFTGFRTKSFRFRGHPQEVSENSSDLGHFGVVHGYLSAEVLGDVEVDGHVLRSTYAVQRSLDLIGLPGKTRLQFTAELHGLGYSVVRAKFPQLRLDTWLLVLPTPVDAEHVHLRVASAMRPFPLVPSPVMRVLHRFVLEAFSSDVADDIPLWSKKRYIARPQLAPGDGPIATYRRYAEQFYPPGRVALTTVEDASAE